jgi:hypothetical protein
MKIALEPPRVAALDALIAASGLPTPNTRRPEQIVVPDHPFDRALQVFWVERLNWPGDHPFGFPQKVYGELLDAWDALPPSDPRRTPANAAAMATLSGEPQTEAAGTAGAVPGGVPAPTTAPPPLSSSPAPADASGLGAL